MLAMSAISDRSMENAIISEDDPHVLKCFDYTIMTEYLATIIVFRGIGIANCKYYITIIIIRTQLSVMCVVSVL